MRPDQARRLEMQFITVQVGFMLGNLISTWLL